MVFSYKQKSKVQHSTEVSLNISTNKLQERIELKCYQITQLYPTIFLVQIENIKKVKGTQNLKAHNNYHLQCKCKA
jgi:hypothetical protein